MTYLEKTHANLHLICAILQKPERDEWGSGLEAMQAALALEKSVNQSLLDLHSIADSHKDPQVRQENFLISIFACIVLALDTKIKNSKEALKYGG